MYILCIVKDETREGQRKASGKMIRHRVGIGVDRFNISLCETTAEAFQGKKFSPRFAFLVKYFGDFGVDPEYARCQLRDALSHIFGEELPDDITFAQMDEHFHPGKCAPDSTGEIEFYRALKEKYGTKRGGDSHVDDKGAIILFGGDKEGDRLNRALNVFEAFRQYYPPA